MRTPALLSMAVTLVLLSPQLTMGSGEEWVELYNGPANDWDQALGIAVSEDGVFVTGLSYTAGPNQDFATVRYEFDGSFDWVATYDGPAGDYDCPNDIVTDGSGHVYVTGSSEGTSSFQDIVTIKYTEEGGEDWAVRYDGPASDWDTGVAIAVDDTGNVYVAGSRSSAPANSDYVTIKYGPEGGERWVATYDGPVGAGDGARDVAIDGDGYVYVTGGSVGEGTAGDIVTIRYTPDGEEDWVARYNGPWNSLDEASAMALDDSANIYVTGTCASVGGDSDIVTIKYGPEGDEKWVETYDGPSNHHDYGRDIAVAPLGDVLVLGESYDTSSGYGWVTQRYSPDGTVLWTERYDGPGGGNDSPSAIAAGGDGAACATGWLQDGSVATLRYGVSGDLEWMAIYNRHSGVGSQSRGIAVDASGCIYVVGETYDDATAYDFVTLKYDPSTGVVNEEEAGARVHLFPASPNPSTGSTGMVFDLAADAPEATLAVYDAAGRLVSVLLEGPVMAGPGTVSWDGTDGTGSKVAAGVYFVKLTVGHESETQKVVLIN